MTNQGNTFDGIPFCQISELRLLKVLDLRSYFVESLSSATFKKLNHLKYLAVMANKFDIHPESHLPCVETLIVRSYVKVTASFMKMEKLRHVEINVAEFDLEEDKHVIFEGSSKLENLRRLGHVRFSFEEVDKVDVLSRRCPNLQELMISFWGDHDSAERFCLTLENLTQLQILCLFFWFPKIISGLQLPSNLNKLVLLGSHIESAIPFIAGLPSLEYLRLEDLESIELSEWCLGDITFPKLKLLKLVSLDISIWDASEESFPLLETLVIKNCRKLEEIPLSFADIPTLKQIKLIWCHNKSLEDSAVRIKKEVDAIEGCDRIDITAQDTSGGNIRPP